MSINEHYAAVLSDLKQMKADAEAGITAIERLISRTPAPTQREKEESLFEDFVESGDKPAKDVPSVPQRVIAFLMEHPGQTFDADEIGKGTGIGRDQIRTLRGALSRLSKAKKISKYARGRFRARRANETEPLV